MLLRDIPVEVYRRRSGGTWRYHGSGKMEERTLWAERRKTLIGPERATHGEEYLIVTVGTVVTRDMEATVIVPPLVSLRKRPAGEAGK